MICPAKEANYINEIEDIDRIERAYAYEEERAYAEYIALKSKNKGRYGVPSKRLSPYIDKSEGLVGKTMTLEEVDGNGFENVRVKTAEPVGNSLVRINNQYTVDMQKHSTTNGMYMVELGSETTKEAKLEKVSEVSGELAANIDVMLEKALEMDKGNVDAKHLRAMKELVGKYKHALLESGSEVKVTAEFLKDLGTKNNTRGRAYEDKNGKRIDLILGNQRLNGATEILAHELQHIMIREVLLTDNDLSMQVLKLRDGLAKVIDEEVFLHESYTTDEKRLAKERYQYVFHSTGTSAADEFLAYATTNKELMEALDMTLVPGSEMELIRPLEIKGGKSFFNKMKMFWNKLSGKINEVHKMHVTQGKNSKEYARALLDKALELKYRSAKDREQSRYEKVIGKITGLDKTLAKATGLLKKDTKSYKEAMQRHESGGSLLERAWKIKALARARSVIKQNNIFTSVTRDMDNMDVAKFYQMFRHAKAFVENAVAPMKQATINVLTEEYGFGDEKLGGKEHAKRLRRAAKRVVIDADAAVLGNSEEILKYLKDPKKVDDELNAFAKKYNKDIVLATQALGEMLVTNKMTIRNGYANAAQINWDHGDSTNRQMEDDIDRAATLVAIRESGKENVALAIELLEKNARGMDYVMEMKKSDEKALLEKAYDNDRMYAIKGAKQEKYHGTKKHYIVKKSEVKELQKAKMHYVGKHEELSRVVGEEMYVMIGDAIDPNYTEGLLTTVQLRNEGDSVRKILADVRDMTEEEANDRIEEFVKDAKIGTTEALIPERSGLGQIYDYRVRMPHEVKDMYLGVEDDIVQTIAETMANLTHKQEAMLNNRASLIFMNSFYDKYKNSKDFKFIEISADSKGKFKEYWDIIPYYLKKSIEKEGGKLMVEEGMLVDYFGYTDVSLVNAKWVKDSKRRQVLAKKAESLIEEIAKSWKHSVVAKTFSTIKGNMQSNMIVGMQHTNEGPVAYAEQFGKYWGHLNEYKAHTNKLRMLEIRQKAGESIDVQEMNRLKTLMVNSPVHSVMEDGQYTHILEDIDKEWFDEKGMLEEKIDKIIDMAKTKKGSNPLKGIVDTLYVRKDSPLYDSTMKLTLYADVTNKLIILESLKKKSLEMKANGKSNEEIGEEMLNASAKEMDKFFKTGVIPQTWLNYVDQLHVNYGYLDNRWIKRANDTLALSFTKYFFRIISPMVKLLQRRSVTVFLTEAIQKATNIDFETPLDQFYNPFTSVFRKTSAWGDPMNVFGLMVTPAAIR